MSNRTTSKLVLVAAVMVIVGLPLLLMNLLSTQKWVGFTDIQVQFVVTDADSGKPVPLATIDIQVESGGFCEDHGTDHFKLTTDDSGVAAELAKKCMCFGSHGTFENTFGSHLPLWSYQVSAEGYESTVTEYLEKADNASRVQRGTPTATLTVSISLPRRN